MELSSASPATLGKYQIRGILGRGAMGTVYDGWDPVIGRRVAIKTVRLLGDADPEVKEGLERFKREAQAAGRLSHPNIVGVYDYGETDETAYIVMEFVEGPSLKDLLDARERFPIEETVRIMEQVLAGLQFSHEHGVVHRDIKPGNVMIAKGGRVKLADFGIARIESSVMTQDGTMLGTPAYMSPEQLMAQTVDARSDIYSSGVMLYQLLTGERPFEGGLTAIIHKALNTVPPRPSELAVTAPPRLDPVVARAMSKRPADRYPDADSFARALREAMAAPPPGPAADDATFIAGPPADATLVTRAAPPPPPPPMPAPVEAASPAPAVPAPVETVVPASKGPNKAVFGGIAAIVVLTLGIGGWLATRPSAPQATTQAATQQAPQPAPAPAPVPTPTTVAPPASPPAAAAPAPKREAEAATPAPPAATPPAQATSPPMPAQAPPPQAAVTPAPTPPPAAPPTAPEAPAPVAQATPPPASVAASPPAPPPPPPPAAQEAAPPQQAPPSPAETPAPPERLAGIVPPSPAAIRAALASLAASANCAIPRFSVADDGGISAAGLVGTGAPDTALRAAVEKVAGGAQLSWLMLPVDGPYCEAFDVLRPIAQPASPAFGLTMKDNLTRLKDNDPIRPILTLPGFPAYLQVDYLSHDGSVAHLLSSQGGKARPYPAGTTLALGDPKLGVGAVGPPFGTDVILAIASSTPLFPKPRPDQTETAQAYLPALQAALDAAGHANARLTGRALVLETMPR